MVTNTNHTQYEFDNKYSKQQMLTQDIRTVSYITFIATEFVNIINYFLHLVIVIFIYKFDISLH